MLFEKKKRFIEGVQLISSNLTDDEFEVALKEFGSEYDPSSWSQIERLSLEENVLISKTILYIAQRLKIFLLSPVKLHSDLSELGFSPEKAEIIVKSYSESNRKIMCNLSAGELENNAELAWEIKTTMMDETTPKCKKPAARITIKNNVQVITLEGLNHSDLSALFEDLEIIQKELDAFSANK